MEGGGGGGGREEGGAGESAGPGGGRNGRLYRDVSSAEREIVRPIFEQMHEAVPVDGERRMLIRVDGVLYAAYGARGDSDECADAEGAREEHALELTPEPASGIGKAGRLRPQPLGVSSIISDDSMADVGFEMPSSLNEHIYVASTPRPGIDGGRAERLSRWLRSHHPKLYCVFDVGCEFGYPPELFDFRVQRHPPPADSEGCLLISSVASFCRRLDMWLKARHARHGMHLM